MLLALAVRHWGAGGALAGIVIVPSTFAAWQLWAGWPAYAAINSDVSAAWRDVAAAGSYAIALASIWVIGRIMLNSPPEPRSAEPARERERLSV